MCSDHVDETRSRKLKSSILAYFDEQPHFEAGQITMLSFAREMDIKKAEGLDEEVSEGYCCGKVYEMNVISLASEMITLA